MIFDEEVDTRNQSFSVDLRIDYSSEAENLGVFQDVFQTRTYDFSVYSSSNQITSGEDFFTEGSLLDNESNNQQESEINNESSEEGAILSIGRGNNTQQNGLTQQTQQINERINLVTILLILVIIASLIIIIREVL